MKKITQDKNILLQGLSSLDSDWKDELSMKVISLLEDIEEVSDESLQELLDRDFEAASTIFRLFLEKSKDEYTALLKHQIPQKGMAGSKGYKKDKAAYTDSLDMLGLKDRMETTLSREYTWKDIIIERLKSGRGSAIKGQKRGRQLEDFVESIVSRVFSEYEPRCSFIGMTGQSTEKADFAIPSRNNPEIIIEVKGYGATGSKQTDVIGDINRIIQEKRHDSTFLLFTDGISWKERESDFRKLVDFQNQGYIYKIYTKSMEEEFLNDLRLMKDEKNL